MGRPLFWYIFLLCFPPSLSCNLRHELTSCSTGGQDPLFVQYNESLTYDARFWRQDIDGSIAFARANHECGILTAFEFAEIERGFQKVAEEWRTGTFEAKDSDEDIHTANERRLGEIIDKGISGKLHTFVAHSKRHDSC